MIKLLTVPLLLFALTSYAVETDEVSYAIADNISSEYTSCAAYFSLVSHAVKNSKEPEVAEKYKEMYEISMQGALTLAKSIREESMAMKVTLARFENSLSSMSNDIGNDFSNISILFSQYSNTCKNALEKPEEFIKNITDRTISKYKNKSH